MIFGVRIKKNHETKQIPFVVYLRFITSNLGSVISSMA
jgi:hypothetical protein